MSGMEQLTLFGGEENQPLAARLRPRTLEEFVGQTQLLGEGKVLRRLIESDQISSMIFWRGEDDSGPDHSQPDEGGVYRFLRGDQRDQGDPRGDGAGGGQPPLRGEDHRVCG